MATTRQLISQIILSNLDLLNLGDHQIGHLIALVALVVFFEVLSHLNPPPPRKRQGR